MARARQALHAVWSRSGFLSRAREAAYLLPWRRRQATDIQRSGRLQNQLLRGLVVRLDLAELHDYFMWRELRVGGAYEAGTTALLERELGPGDTFVDVGANNGYFAVVALAKVGPTGRVIALEPNPRALARLSATFEANGRPSNLMIRPEAASDHDGTLPLEFPSRFDSQARLGSVSAPGDSVPVRTLDSLLGPTEVHLVKIDVEGHELQVLGGMREVQRRNPALRLVVEWNSLYAGSDLWARLHERFEVFRISETAPVELTPVESPRALRFVTCNLYCRPLKRPVQ